MTEHYDLNDHDLDAGHPDAEAYPEEPYIDQYEHGWSEGPSEHLGFGADVSDHLHQGAGDQNPFWSDDHGWMHGPGDHLGFGADPAHGMQGGLGYEHPGFDADHHALADELSPSGEGMFGYSDFDPGRDRWDGAGDPAADMHYWHEQQAPDTCAIASQEFILDGLTGHHFTEHQLRDEAEEHGWYTPGGGTPMHDMGNLLEAHGLDVEREQGATIDDLSNALAHGEKVMVGVDHESLAGPEADSWNLDQYPGIPGQHADHAVEVIGIEQDAANGPTVVLNDPGRQDGRGMMVPLDTFEASWSESGDLAVIAAAPHSGESLAHTAAPAWPHELSFGGYYNNDGTWHCETDNTDTDPVTGRVVSWG